MIIEVSCPPSTGTFVLGRDLLDVDPLTDIPDEWIDITLNATSIQPSTGGDSPFGIPEPGGLTVNVKDLDVETPWGIATPGRPIRIRADELPGTPAVWFGRITDAPTIRSGAHTYTTITASDILARSVDLPVTRWFSDGTLKDRVADLAAVSTPAIRFERIDRRYPVRNASAVTSTAGITTVTPTLPSKVEVRLARAVTAGETFIVTLTFGAAFTESILTTVAFTLARSWWAGFTPTKVEISERGVFRTLGPGPGTYSTEVEFLAGDATVELRITTPSVGAGAGIDLTGMTLAPLRPPDAATLAATAPNAATLGEHLSRASLTARGAWRAAITDGAIEVLDTLPLHPIATITDAAAGYGPTVASYTDIQLAHNTGPTFANALDLTNHKSEWIDGKQEDTTTVHTAENDESIVRVGRRPADAATIHNHPPHADEHALELLEHLSTDGWEPLSASYRLKDLDVIPRVHDLVDVVSGGTTCTVRVTSIALAGAPKTTTTVTLTFRRR